MVFVGLIIFVVVLIVYVVEQLKIEVYNFGEKSIFLVLFEIISGKIEVVLIDV